MVQIKVYDAAGSQFWLDTYEEQPIKITMAIEDIEKVSAMSSFSRTFRVPGTKHNYQYFKTMFLVEGQDFDVTRKAKAIILVDGAQFSVGHIRVQKVFVNHSNNKYEYEVTYMGETRDFAAALADKPMCELEINALAHNFDQTAVTQSWQAYPETTSGLNGLKKGNVLYPLIDFGNTYPGTNQTHPNETGEPRIAVDHPSSDGGSFDNHNHGIQATRFKPMIRAKCLIDQIFYDSDYTYTSNFLGDMEDPVVGNADTSLFKQIYVSAFGNDESIFVDPNIGSTNTFSAEGLQFQSADEYLECPIEISDPGNNYDNTTYTYTAPGSTPGASFTCSFVASAAVYGEQGSYGSIESYPVRLILFREQWNSSGFLPTPYASNSTDDGTCTLTVTNATFNIGDKFRVYIIPDGGGGSGTSPIIAQQAFRCTAASVGDFNPIAYMDCEYKQIDFVKDLLTTFRLVMAPNPNKPRDFIIEPAQQYYRTGIQRDWSNKLDNEKDQIIEPLFYTQTDQIDYKHEEDEDYINAYHREVYKENYGYLEFDSGNELLKGTREIMTKWAPTPITQIEGTLQSSGWVIPQIHTRSAEPDGTQFLPIKAKTRWLFYNGLQNLPAGEQWYFDGQGTNNGQDSWPLVSNSSTWPMDVNGTVLNWFNDIGYWGTNVPGFPTQRGQTIYETYWNNNIINTYDKYARRMTATFVLDSTDLIDLQFSDTIFVNGTWYRPEKILDYQVGKKCKVKCQLIKVIPAYKPYLTPVQCSMTVGAVAGTESSACNNTTADQTVTYESTANLQVGDTLQLTSPGIFRNNYVYVISAECDPQLVGKVIFFNDANGEILAITDPCAAPPTTFNYTAQYCSDPTQVLTVQSGLNNIIAGAIMQDTQGICMEITGTSTNPPSAVLDDTQSYATCSDCTGVAPTYTYFATHCDGQSVVVSSTLSNLLAGAVMKNTAGDCLTIGGTSTSTPFETLDDSVSYSSCTTCNPPVTYDCVNGTCVDPGDGSGQYSTLSQCQNSCFVPQTYWFFVETCEGSPYLVQGNQNTVIGNVYYWGTNSGPDERGEILNTAPAPSDPSQYPTIVGPAFCEIRPIR